MVFDLDLIKKVYAGFKGKVDDAKAELGRPMTLTEKILYAHLHANTKLQSFGRWSGLC